MKFYEQSQEGASFLALGEPIKIGHHSERRHRALIERNNSRMSKSVNEQNIADDYQRKADYWKKKGEEINLSMPESVEYFQFELEKATIKHKGLKDGTIERSHSYSLTYAKKAVNEATKKLEIARKLWL